MKLKKALKKIKRSLVALGVTILASGVFTANDVSAHNAYYLSVTIDPETNQYIGLVSEDKNDIGTKNHAEINNTGVYFGKIADGNSYVKNSDPKDSIEPFSLPPYGDDAAAATEISTYATAYKTFIPSDSPGGSETLIFSFPGVHVDSATNVFRGVKRDGGGQDREQAQWVSRNLIGGLNHAIAYVHSHSYSDNDNARGRTLNTGRALANAGSRVAGVNNHVEGTATTFSVNGVTYEVVDGRDVSNKNPDIFMTYYIKLRKEGEKEWQHFPWAVPKGYGKDHRLFATIKDSEYYEKQAKKDARFLSWQHVVMQASYNATVTGLEFSSADQLNPPNWIEQAIAFVLSSVVHLIESLLGLFSLPELMLNRGAYEQHTWQGIMPTGLADVADQIHIFVQFIAWLLIAGALALMLSKRNLSAINPKMRVELQEGLLDLLGAGAALLMFIPIFRSMVTMNAGLVQFFGGISNKVDMFGTASTTNGGYIAPILISIVMLGITIYMNITYIMRGITIAVMYVLAPIFMVSIAYGGQAKQLFSTFMKELVGLIFMQTIHAVMISLYTLAFFNGVAINMLYTLVLSASFIPITKFIRNDLLGLKEGMGGSFGSGAVAAGAGMAFAGASAMKTSSDIKKMGSAASDTSTNFGRKSTITGGGDGGGGSRESVQTMLDNDSLTSSKGIGSTPDHYAGGGKTFTAQEAVQEKRNFKEYVADGIEKSAPAREMAGKALKTGAKAAIGAGAMAAATTLETATDSRGITQGASSMINQSNNAKRIAAMGGRGGGGYGGFGDGQNRVPMPDHKSLEQFQAQGAENSGFVVSGGKENGDIVNIHETGAMMEGAGIESMIDNDSHLLAKTTTDSHSDDVVKQMRDDFNSGDAELMAHWQAQGVDFAKETSDGKTLIGYNKETLGINDFEQDNKYTKFDIKPTTNQQFFRVDNLQKRPPIVEPTQKEKKATG